MQSVAVDLPSSAYWLVGVLVLANFGTIISVLVMGFKGAWWLSKLDSRVESVEKSVDSLTQADTELRLAINKY
jgi:hypothetical protein